MKYDIRWSFYTELESRSEKKDCSPKSDVPLDLEEEVSSQNL
jgi:hypothetical protein